MHPLAETLLDEPVIAAVKTDEALTAALASPCSAVFLLASTLLFRRGRSRWTPSTPCATRTASSPPTRP